MLLQEISTRTKSDWQLFESLKAQALQPSAEDLLQQEQQRVDALVAETISYLSLYGIVFTGLETDFSDLYRLYILGGEGNNIPMFERIGDNNELERVYNDRVVNFNSLQDFCQFIISYER